MVGIRVTSAEITESRSASDELRSANFAILLIFATLEVRVKRRFQKRFGLLVSLRVGRFTAGRRRDASARLDGI